MDRGDEPWWIKNRKIRESFVNQCLRKMREKGYTYDDGQVVTPRGRRMVNNVRRGYPSIYYRLYNGRNGVYRVPLHRFVAYLKFGDDALREGVVVRHLDGDPANSHPDNLALGSYSDNMMDIPPEVRTTKARAAARAGRKFTPEQVRSMRKKSADGVALTELCAEFGVTRRAISYIVSGKTYQDVE